jgi:hypothetical protein
MTMPGVRNHSPKVGAAAPQSAIVYWTGKGRAPPKVRYQDARRLLGKIERATRELDRQVEFPTLRMVHDRVHETQIEAACNAARPPKRCSSAGYRSPVAFTSSGKAPMPVRHARHVSRPTHPSANTFTAILGHSAHQSGKAGFQSAKRANTARMVDSTLSIPTAPNPSGPNTRRRRSCPADVEPSERADCLQNGRSARSDCRYRP